MRDEQRQELAQAHHADQKRAFLYRQAGAAQRVDLPADSDSLDLGRDVHQRHSAPEQAEIAVAEQEILRYCGHKRRLIAISGALPEAVLQGFLQISLALRPLAASACGAICNPQLSKNGPVMTAHTALKNPRTADHPIHAQFTSRFSPRGFTEKSLTEAEVLALLKRRGGRRPPATTSRGALPMGCAAMRRLAKLPMVLCRSIALGPRKPQP